MAEFDNSGNDVMKSRLSRYMLIIGSGALLAFLIVGSLVAMQQMRLDNSDDWVTHTYEVIVTGKDLDASIQRMIVSERGYLLTRQEEFRSDYQVEKARAERALEAIKKLTRDHPQQSERLEKVAEQILALRQLLESRIQKATESNTIIPINAEAAIMSKNIQTNLDELLAIEDGLLTKRLGEARASREQYNNLLYGGVGAAILVIILLNTLVLKLQVRRDMIAAQSRRLDERFALAMKATSDGIFDWDIEHGTLFLSQRFKQMLGYRDEELDATTDAIAALIHPDDAENLQHYTEDYFAGKYSEYNAVYRLQHKTGGYLWVHSRAKAVFDANRQATRLIGAIADITSMKSIEERLRVEKEMAVSANKAKTDFLTNMSHEIRTPLNAIIGVSGILARKMAKTEEQQDKLISTLQHSSTALLDLVNDVLDLAKIESNEMDLEYRPFQLGKLMQQVASMMAVRAQEKNLRFRMDIGEFEKAMYVGDEGRLRQILINLVGNSVKFTEKGEIALVLRRKDGELRFDVKDTGIGIAEDDIQKIFHKFEQVDSSTTRKYGGTGLGLAISQKIAAMMGGRIEVKSALGNGSIFSLFVPDNTEADSPHEPPKPLEKEMPIPPIEKKILIAEDFENNLLVIKFFMESLGIPYDIAHNGMEAVALYKKHRHPFVMMDVQMPGMDGLDATRLIREYEKEQGLPRTSIIAMTAHAMAGDSARCMDAGMNDYLAKPLLESDIRQKLKLYLTPLGANS